MKQLLPVFNKPTFLLVLGPRLNVGFFGLTDLRAFFGAIDSNDCCGKSSFFEVVASCWLYNQK